MWYVVCVDAVIISYLLLIICMICSESQKESKIVELIVNYGEISIVKNDCCSESICQISCFKVNKIHKLVNGFKHTCIESYARQLSNCDRSKRCRRNNLLPLQELKKYCFTFRKILSVPSLQQHTTLNQIIPLLLYPPSRREPCHLV